MADVASTSGSSDPFVLLAREMWEARSNFDKKCAELVRLQQAAEPRREVDRKKMELEEPYEKFKEVLKKMVAYAENPK
ncbi:PREDICTED: uncharacterized protein LOC109132296 [Camelina sativa]|uniref:Uncharacterized protein LOC109132296 n=1 Tax=Camelina sativa TaxID=90675 RepID=A0ABM1RKE1_CAMSA|nr:PREDICTED: uncharacterized protein LOC109132296 [Camelina sativa]